jgi:hypothetical protein
MGGMHQMDYQTISKLIMDDVNMRILSATAFESLSARDLAYMFSIPLVSCYRKINELESAGLLKCVDKPLKANGKRVRKYKSQLIKVVLTFERGKLRIALDVSWKRTQHFEASWTTELDRSGLDGILGGSSPGTGSPTK